MDSSFRVFQGGAETFAEPFMAMFAQVAAFLPNILVAFVILVVGLIISPLVGAAVTKLLQTIKTDQAMDKVGAQDALGSIGLHFSLSKAAGTFVKYVVLIVFLTMVAETLQLQSLSRLIDLVILYIPQVVIALVIMGVGLTIADFLQNTVSNIASASDNADYAGILGSTTRIAVIVFSAMAALTQLGIGDELIQIMFAGVVFALALAFGLGAKDLVADTLEGWTKHK